MTKEGARRPGVLGDLRSAAWLVSCLRWRFQAGGFLACAEVERRNVSEEGEMD